MQIHHCFQKVCHCILNNILPKSCFRRKNEFILKFKFVSLTKHDFGAYTLHLWNHSPIPVEITQLIQNADITPVRTNSQSKRRTSESQIKYNPGHGPMECMPRKFDRCSGNGFLCINTITQEGFQIDARKLSKLDKQNPAEHEVLNENFSLFIDIIV